MPPDPDTDIRRIDNERRQDQAALLKTANGIRDALVDVGSSVKRVDQSIGSDRWARRTTMALLLVMIAVSSYAVYGNRHSDEVARCRSRLASSVDVTKGDVLLDFGANQKLQNDLLATELDPSLNPAQRVEKRSSIRSQLADTKTEDEHVRLYEQALVARGETDERC